MNLCFSTRKLAKFSIEREEADSRGNRPCISQKRVIGGGDDEALGKGFLPDSRLADPPLPLSM